jgi:hypothetical protein
VEVAFSCAMKSQRAADNRRFDRSCYISTISLEAQFVE